MDQIVSSTNYNCYRLDNRTDIDWRVFNKLEDLEFADSICVITCATVSGKNTKVTKITPLIG